MQRSISRTFLSMLSVAALVAGGALLVGCSDDDDDDGCGNGQIDSGEQCDGANLGGATCQTVGNYVGGTLSCTSQCTFNTGMCTSSVNCGNGQIDDPEECDGANLNSQTCETVGNYTGGTLACAGDCTFDTSQCVGSTDCGNGQIDAPEECDGANLNSQTCETVGNFTGGTLDCNDDCTFDTTLCTPASDCPHVDLGSDTSISYAGDTTGLPNLVTSTRLEWQNAPDDSLLFTAPQTGDYLITLVSEPSSNGGCGPSVKEQSTDTYYDASWCPAVGSTTAIDGEYAHGGSLYPLDQGETVLIWFSCTYWADVQYGAYEITIELQ